MGFRMVESSYRDHDEEWVRAGTHGALELSRATAERWFSDVDHVLFLVDPETARVVIMPETDSASDEDKRKLTKNDAGYASVSFGCVCNEFGFSAQDIDDTVVFDVEENGQYGGPMFDMGELVERYAPS